MNTESQSPLAGLIEIGSLDARLARIVAERKQISDTLTEQRKLLEDKQRVSSKQQAMLAERQERIRREEKLLKEEREKLVGRRKSLESLGSYKLQQAGQREIEHASKQLDLREEALLKSIDEVAALEEMVKNLSEECVTLQEAHSVKLQESEEQLMELERRQGEITQERQQLVDRIPAEHLRTYDRVKSRHVMDAIVPLQDQSSCSGCFMQVGPQVVVEVARGNKIVRCPGCGRILFLQEGEEE